MNQVAIDTCVVIHAFGQQFGEQGSEDLDRCQRAQHALLDKASVILLPGQSLLELGVHSSGARLIDHMGKAGFRVLPASLGALRRAGELHRLAFGYLDSKLACGACGRKSKEDSRGDALILATCEHYGINRLLTYDGKMRTKFGAFTPVEIVAPPRITGQTSLFGDSDDSSFSPADLLREIGKK